MQKVLIDNIKTFQRAYFDLQTPLRKFKDIKQSLNDDKINLQQKFDQIWNDEEDVTCNDDFVRDLELIFKKNIEKLESAVKDANDYMAMQTKKFRDKELEIIQMFVKESGT